MPKKPLWKYALATLDHDAINLAVPHPLDRQRRLRPLLRALVAVGERPTSQQVGNELRRLWGLHGSAASWALASWRVLEENPYHAFRDQRSYKPNFQLLDRVAQDNGLPGTQPRLVKMARAALTTYVDALQEGRVNEAEMARTQLERSADYLAQVSARGSNVEV